MSYVSMLLMRQHQRQINSTQKCKHQRLNGACYYCKEHKWNLKRYSNRASHKAQCHNTHCNKCADQHIFPENVAKKTEREAHRLNEFLDYMQRKHQRHEDPSHNIPRLSKEMKDIPANPEPSQTCILYIYEYYNSKTYGSVQA